MNKNTNPDFTTITEFENQIAKFFGSNYAVAVDCCTHALELCLRYTKASTLYSPTHTYISVPFLAKKLNIDLVWREENWKDYYYITSDIIDAAVFWKQGGYKPDTFMCLSFQYRKHLSLGRGGMILTDNKEAAVELKKMSYDGRLPDIPWREQNISSYGWHYYMTPETAQLGLERLPKAIATEPEQWSTKDWPDVSQMDVFKTKPKFKLFNSVSYSEFEPLVPFTLEKEFNNLEDVYKYLNTAGMGTWFICDEKGAVLTSYTNPLPLSSNSKDKTYIHESPDNGKTVYRREFGKYDNREQIK